MPDSIVEKIKQPAALCREWGNEPNRVRISPYGYRLLFDEAPDVILHKKIDGLAIEMWYTCPRDDIIVDRKPEDEELPELEAAMRLRMMLSD